MLEFIYAVAKDGQAERNPVLVDVRERLYDPLRREAGLDLVSRKGPPSHALQEATRHMAAAINTNICKLVSRRYLALRDNLDKRQAWDKQRAINEAAGSGATADDSLPPKLDKSVAYDLAAHPERFLWTMWRMDAFFEERGERKFAVLPLSTGFVPGACLHIDTDALLQLVGHGHPALAAYRDARSAQEAHERERRQAAGIALDKRRPPGCKNDLESMAVKDKAWAALFDFERVVPASRIDLQRIGHHLTTDGCVRVRQGHASTARRLSRTRSVTVRQEPCSACQEAQDSQGAQGREGREASKEQLNTLHAAPASRARTAQDGRRRSGQAQLASSHQRVRSRRPQI